MDTSIEEIYNTIQEFETNKGGDFAQNGFSFQVACLMLDILIRFKDNQDFIVCGETVDDYVIVDKLGIKVCQCKNFKTKSYTLNSLTSKVKNKSLWDKMSGIYQKLKLLVRDSVKIYSWLLINKTNRISLIVENENKQACNTKDYENHLQLSLITSDEKKSLNETNILLDSDFENFNIYKILGYDTYDSEVKDIMEEIINDKYSEDAKYNPIVLYRTLISKVKERSVKKIGTNLKTFTEDIENILRFNTDKFYDFVNVKNLIVTSYSFDIVKVNEVYNYLKCVLSPLKPNMLELKDFLEVKSLIEAKKNFDEIIDYCIMKKCLIKYTTIDEIIALILLCKGEKI